MNIDELSQKLDEAISCYKQEAGQACSICSDDNIGDALKVSHDATANALASFKAEILAYLMMH